MAPPKTTTASNKAKASTSEIINNQLGYHNAAVNATNIKACKKKSKGKAKMVPLDLLSLAPDSHDTVGGSLPPVKTTPRPTAASLRAATQKAREEYEAAEKVGADPTRLLSFRQVLNSAEADEHVDATLASNFVDLHDLHLQDALRITGRELKNWWANTNGSATFKVVTGRGIHSRDGKAVLKPEVKKLLEKGSWSFRQEAGAYIVQGLLGSIRGCFLA